MPASRPARTLSDSGTNPAQTRCHSRWLRSETVNVVTLIGNLAHGVELKSVGDGKRVASFVLAIDRPTKDGGADFVRDRRLGAPRPRYAYRYLAKGRRVGLDGRLRSRSWEDTDGTRRNALEVVANRIEFLSPPSGEEAAGEVPFAAAAA